MALRQRGQKWIDGPIAPPILSEQDAAALLLRKLNMRVTYRDDA